MRTQKKISRAWSSCCRMPLHNTRLLWPRRRKNKQHGRVTSRAPAMASLGVACQTCSWAATAMPACWPTRATFHCLHITAPRCKRSMTTYYPASRSAFRCGIRHDREPSQPALQRCFWGCWNRRPASIWLHAGLHLYAIEGHARLLRALAETRSAERAAVPGIGPFAACAMAMGTVKEDDVILTYLRQMDEQKEYVANP